MFTVRYFVMDVLLNSLSPFQLGVYAIIYNTTYTSSLLRNLWLRKTNLSEHSYEKYPAKLFKI